jgi:hypothetical protein
MLKDDWWHLFSPTWFQREVLCKASFKPPVPLNKAKAAKPATVASRAHLGYSGVATIPVVWFPSNAARLEMSNMQRLASSNAGKRVLNA